MVRSDVPQALWGVGNAASCNINGFLFQVGMTAVPMYTLCLCIYYVCKMKGKMTDAQFTTKIEKKMHLFIILSNLGMYLTTMGMGIINPGVLGNLCTIAAFPTGCRQNPEMFGECDPFIANASAIFAVATSSVIPIVCLFGILACMAILFWNVVVMNRIFGRARGMQRIPRTARRREATSAMVTGISSRRSNEESSSMNSSEHSIDVISFPLPMDQSPETSHGQNSLNGVENNASDRGRLSVSNPQSTTNRTFNSANRDPDSVSRLYKKELVIQACSYVAVYCTTIFVFSTFTTMLILGIPPGKKFIVATSALYPLGGFLNILVYTRPSVANFLRKCPECSRLVAFWLVLKAGGEVPDENEWMDRKQNRRSVCDLCWLLFTKKNVTRDEEGGPVLVVSQDTISDLPFGMPSHPLPPDESLPDSGMGMNGLSQSLESANVAHRSPEDWSHLEGEGSKLAIIPERESSVLESSIVEESSEKLISQEYAVDVSSTKSSSASRKVEKRRKDEWEEMWEHTFKRVREWTPSM